MDKLKLHTPDLTAANIEKIAALFPNCITEARDDQGMLTRKIDFDQLRQELSDHVVDGPRERYQLDWPGKREALLAANAPIAKTLRPCRAESVDFDTTKNLFIEGDNLDATKLLRETYLGAAKLVYLDPPYNTGNDFVYDDDFSEDNKTYLAKSNQRDEIGNRLLTNTDSNGRFHSAWLSMMYPRLLAARDLLSDDGVIVISIDENENANLRKLCDLVFGANNFAGEIVWKNSSKNDQDYVSIQHEYIVIYVKDKTVNKGLWKEKKEGLAEIYSAFESFRAKHKENWSKIHDEAVEWYKQFQESNPISSSKHYNWMDSRGVYFPDNISGPNDGQYVYEVQHPVTKKACKAPSRGWFCPPESMRRLLAEDRIHFGIDHTTVPNLKTYLKNTEFQSVTSLRFVDGRAASKRLRALFGEKVFTNPKDEILLKDLMKAFGLKDNDLVIDLFAGSGTTMHSTFLLNAERGSNCRCILVQLPDDLNASIKRATGSSKKVIENAIFYLKQKCLPHTTAEIGKERIRLVGNLVKEECATTRPDLDIGFRVLKVDSSNMTDVYYAPDTVKQDDLLAQTDNIKPDRTPEDLLFQVLVDWGVDLSLPITQEKIAGKRVFFVDGNALAACFEPKIGEDLVKELAKLKPLRVVFRDRSYDNDSVKINVEQIFKLLSPETEVKSL